MEDIISTSEQILTTDGIPLKVSLRKTERKNKIRAFLLVFPLLMFIIVTFVVPIGDMLLRSVDDSQINGESIGMMRFNEEGANLFKNKLDFMMRYRSGSNQWYLAAIDELAKEEKVSTCPVDGAIWCEVDDADDLTAAKQIVSSWDR